MTATGEHAPEPVPGRDGFGARLAAARDAFGPLCVGIDPHESLLNDWGLGDSAAGLREFGLRVVDAAVGLVGVVKPQVAFFERHGSAGFAALEEVLGSAHARGLLVIADAKRGDIGSTMAGYASAWLQAGSPLEADAVTVSPYLGVGSLHPTMEFALAHGKGVFVLAATSNPEALPLQSARREGRSVAESVALDVQTWGEDHERRTVGNDSRLSSCGLVVGATIDRSALDLGDDTLHGMPLLAPGFGAQGARAEDLCEIFGGLAPQVIASESRSILSAGPDGLRDRITERSRLYR